MNNLKRRQLMNHSGDFMSGDGIRLHWEEYGSGDRIVISAMAGHFYPEGLQQAVARRGYHVFCMTLRGFSPSGYVEQDYGDCWYDIFARDVTELADHLGTGKFFYLGASHGAGVGWHLLWRCPERIKAFIAVVPGEKPVSSFKLTVGDREITFSNTSLLLNRNKKYTVNRIIKFHPKVGDPFWSDGTYGRLRHPSSQEKIVGIVVFVHDFKENMTEKDIKIADAITEKASGFGHGLVMALKNVTETNGNQVQKGFKWCSSSAISQQCTDGYITNPNQTMDSPYFSGLENTNSIISKPGYENDSAAAKAKNYTYDGIAVSTSSTTGWFLPSIGQWMYTISIDGFGNADPASEWTNGKGTLWLKDGYQPDSGGNLGDLVFVKRSEDSRPEVNVLVKSLNDRLAQFYNEFGVSYDTFGDPSTETNISDNYWTSTEYAADKAIRMNLGTVEQRAGVYYSTIKAKGETKTISFYTYNSNSYQMKVRPFLAF